MDLIAQIKMRRSTRAFTKAVPPRELLVECLEAAAWAPNQSNQQPWRFIVLQGEKLEKAIRAIEENFAAEFRDREDHPSPAMNPEMLKTLEDRRKRTIKGIESYLRSSGADVNMSGTGNFRFHNAPVGIVFATYPSKSLNFVKSTVAAMQNFVLAAEARGLGTCWLSAVSMCQDHIKAAIDLSNDLILVGGVAVGYPDAESPLNKMPRERLPIQDVVEWLS